MNIEDKLTEIKTELKLNKHEHKSIFAIIEQSIKTANSMSKSIIELYNKIDILTKRVEELESMLAKTEIKESQGELDEKVCDFCGGRGLVIYEDFSGRYTKPCPDCHGTGKIKMKGE